MQILLTRTLKIFIAAFTKSKTKWMESDLYIKELCNVNGVKNEKSVCNNKL